MLDTIPYADLLAIHNALAEKPTRRFDTRANGEKRTAALMEQRGLTLEEAAGLAEVVSPGPGAADESLLREPASEPDEPIQSPDGAGKTSPPMPNTEDEVTVAVNADIALQVKAFIEAISKADRPSWLITFLRWLNGDGPRPAPSAPRDRKMTTSQKSIVELCCRPDGATGKELADGCGWPSIAARATCKKIADRFGYAPTETSRTKERGISFHMAPKPAEA